MQILRFSILLSIFSLISCYPTPSIEGFDKEQWIKALENCTNDRSNQIDILIQNQETLLSKNQNEIKNLLGAPKRHELYRRNQKFFYYPLACKQNKTQEPRELLLRFDALGRVREVQLLENASTKPN